MFPGQRGHTEVQGWEGLWSTVVVEEVTPLARPWLLQAEEERGGGLTPPAPDSAFA